jgi:hypothetical protein
MRVDLVFIDEKGRRWKVYDWSVICGHKYRRSPGEQCAEYRGFVDAATGERRVYLFPTQGAPRICSAFLLRQQLVEARVLEPDELEQPLPKRAYCAGAP